MRTLQPLRPGNAPTGAITVDRAAKLWEIERFGCIQCGCCVETCPKKCLSMKQSYTEPDGTKKTDSFIKTNMPEPAAKPAVKPAAQPAAGQEAAKPAAKAEAAQPAAKPEAAQTAGQEHT